MQCLGRVAVSLAASFCCCWASPAVADSSEVVVLPPEWSSVDLAVDDNGSVHAGFVSDQVASYSSWDGQAKVWRRPVRLSSNGDGTRVFDVRIAVASAGTAAFVAWTQDHEIKGAVVEDLRGTPAVLERSLTKSSVGSAEMPAVAFGPDEVLYAVWIDHRSKGPFADAFQFLGQYLPQRLTSMLGSQAEFASADLWFAVSRNRGRTFDEGKKINDLPVCECCEPSILANAEHGISVVHRSTVQSVKEVQLLTSPDKGVTFARKQISDDRWRFVGCPNSGPQLRLGNGGQSLSAHWMANGSLRGAVAQDVGTPMQQWAALPSEVGLRCDHFSDRNELFVVAESGLVFKADPRDLDRGWEQSGDLVSEGFTVERVLVKARSRLILGRLRPSGKSP